MNKKYWNQIDLSTIDTPALLIDKDMVQQNINLAISYVESVDKLRPHVKTHKMLEVAKMQMAAGINKFKCATIAEAEMLGMAAAKDVVIAYAVQGPKINRLIQLINKFPATTFNVLIDNVWSAEQLNNAFESIEQKINVYFDINNGQNRSGIKVKDAKILFKSIDQMANLVIMGIHCYDGHIRMESYENRVKESTKAFKKVLKFKNFLEKNLNKTIVIIAGGSPSFSVHSKFHDVECSPGTFIFWDARYGNDYQEQTFNKAAVVATRVISKINNHTYCLDLGHKSIAAEFPLPRIEFTEKLDCSQISQSEEHLVIECNQKNALEVGQVLTAYPFHICPTVALYDKANIVENGKIVSQWDVTARNRKITV